MKSIYLSICLLAMVAVVTAGCGCGHTSDDDGVKSSVTTAESEAHDIAVKVNGDWSKLTQAQKDKFKAQFGSVATAKAMLKNMAHPPNESKVKKS